MPGKHHNINIIGGSCGPWRVVSQVYPPNVCAKCLSRRPTNVPILEAFDAPKKNEIPTRIKACVFQGESYYIQCVYMYKVPKIHAI